MGIRHYRPYTPSRRNMTSSTFEEITKKTPEKSLLATKKKNAGRNSYGRITVRHQGGGNRQKYRIIDFKEIKTKQMADAMKNLNVTDKALVLLADKNEVVQKSARNLEGVRTSSVATINVYDLLKYKKLVVTVDTVKKLEEVYA